MKKYYVTNVHICFVFVGFGFNIQGLARPEFEQGLSKRRNLEPSNQCKWLLRRIETWTDVRKYTKNSKFSIMALTSPEFVEEKIWGILSFSFLLSGN